MAEQATIMVIKVDLQCGRCYKKIRKILCEIPQVKDRIFNEKQNTVTITVVCCCPEKIRQKICRKGGEIILGIDIIPPKQEKGVQKPKPSTKDTSTQTQEPDTKDRSPQPTQKGQRPRPFPPSAGPFPPPAVPGYPVAYAMGALEGPYVCPPGHNQGCGWFCPCNYHYGRPPWPICHHGCGRPAHECRCGRLPMCHDGCGRPAHRVWMPET